MRAILFANTDWYLYNFRRSLAQALTDQGHEVVLVSPPGKYGPLLEALGYDWRPLQMQRQGQNPFVEVMNIAALFRLYSEMKPDICHHFTIKCVLYGGLVAKLLKIPSIASIDGMGYIFSSTSTRARLLRPFVRLAYKYVLAGQSAVFQNPDDLENFVSHKIVQNTRRILIRGSGVNVSMFTPRTSSREELRVVFVGRLLHSKGLGDYVSAGHRVARIFQSAKFVVAGSIDDGNPASYTSSEIATLALLPFIKFVGHTEDISKLLPDSMICVLPSFYGEGVPRSLIEAAACGLPLVATDVPGCREICRHGENGFLVPPKNPEALAEAILTLLQDPGLRERMGRRSREIAVAEFSEEKVIRETLAVYEQALKMQL